MDAPVGGGIAAWLHMRGISNEAAVAAGLARVASDGQIRDVFRDRIVVAIRDGQHLAGYAGRALRDDVEPRWLNTRATDAFDKSRLLLGLSEGAERLAAGCTPVLVEGPVDTLAIGQYGGDVVPVALAGTAFTAAHIQALAAAVPADRRRIIVAMDDDEPGRRAAVDAGTALVDAGWLVRTPRDGHGMDPAQIADLHGQKVLDWLDPRRCRSVHHLAAEVYIRSHRDLQTIEGRVHAATTTARLLGERFPPSTETTAAVRLAYDLAGVTPPPSVALGLPTPPRLSSGQGRTGNGARTTSCQPDWNADRTDVQSSRGGHRSHTALPDRPEPLQARARRRTHRARTVPMPAGAFAWRRRGPRRQHPLHVPVPERRPARTPLVAVPTLRP